LSFNAAFTAAGGVVLGPSAVIQGTDAAPEAWPDCPAPGPSVPPLAESGPAASGAGVPLDSLRDFATKVVRGGVLRIEPRLSPSGCDAADPFNWGDPENPHSPCGDYFPVIWVDGNATLYGVRGQGILLVSGDLNLRGGFVFYGGVRIGGMLTSEGSGGWIVGAASAEGDSARSSLMGDGGIRYSSCALSRALTESAGAEPLPSRAWVAVY
jgi:hypothetical protein